MDEFGDKTRELFPDYTTELTYFGDNWNIIRIKTRDENGIFQISMNKEVFRIEYAKINKEFEGRFDNEDIPYEWVDVTMLARSDFDILLKESGKNE